MKTTRVNVKNGEVSQVMKVIQLRQTATDRDVEIIAVKTLRKPEDMLTFYRELVEHYRKYGECAGPGSFPMGYDPIDEIARRTPEEHAQYVIRHSIELFGVGISIDSPEYIRIVKNWEMMLKAEEESSKKRSKDQATEEANKILAECETLFKRTYNESDFIYKQLGALCELESRTKGVAVEVERIAGPIRFSYSGALPAFIDQEHSVAMQHESTNEFYGDRTINTIGKINGIGRYIGVVGGGDQHILLLSALQEHNNLKVTIYDQNPAQIFVSFMAFGSYNNAFKSNRLDEFKVGYHYTIDAPKLRKPLDIRLEHGDIEKAIDKAEPDSYFIYLSNLLTLPVHIRFSDKHKPFYDVIGGQWLKHSDSRKFLLKILENPNISDGSVIFCASKEPKEEYSPSMGHAILIKEGGSLRVHSISRSGQIDVAKLNEHLSTIKNERTFAQWFAQNNIEGFLSFSNRFGADKADAELLGLLKLKR